MTIWTGTLPTIAAGGKILGSDIDTLRDAIGGLTDAWVSFTPAWTGSTTNPVIGNGTLVGAYTRSGKLVHYVGRMFAGSTTTYGSGTYTMSLPVTAADADLGVGSCLLTDASAPTASQAGTCVFSGTSLLRFFAGTGGVVTNLVPYTWANGDRLQWHITYQAA